MMIFTHKSVKIHMLGNKVKNCHMYLFHSILDRPLEVK